MADIYTGPLQTKSTSWLSNLNPANWFQSTPNTSGYSSVQTTPYYTQPQQITPSSTPNYSTLTSVQGPTMQNGQFYTSSVIPGANTNTGINPGSSNTGGGNPAPQAPSQPDYNQLLNNEINNQYNEAINFANQAEQNIRNQYGGVPGQIEAQYGASKKSLDTSKASSEGQLSQAEAGAQSRSTDVVNAARRLFNELQMGGLQRFGGASSAGQAYGELTGREFQRSQAQAAQGLQTAMSSIQQQRADLQGRYDTALANLDLQKQSSLDQARRDFEDKLLQIQQMKSAAGQEKANMRLQALSELRNQAFQIQLNDQQFRQNLQAQASQMGAELDRAMQSFAGNTNIAQNALLGYQQGTTTNPNTAYSMGGYNAPQQVQQFTGVRKPEDKLSQYLA